MKHMTHESLVYLRRRLHDNGVQSFFKILASKILELSSVAPQQAGWLDQGRLLNVLISKLANIKEEGAYFYV
jgi:hypothetical protein